MVALKYWIAWRFGMGCGGCLISNTFVVTAAHCVVDTLEGSYFKPRLWAVRVGACDLANPFEKIIEYGIEQVIMHSKFNRRILANDIALIKTNMPISFNAHVSPICLPTDAMFFNQDFVGKPAVVLGWGRTRYGGPLSHVLKEAILPIVSLEKCRKSYSTVFRGFELTDGVICAGNGSADACQSDSGGPLIFQENRDGALVSSLVGIVSFGKECNNPEYPGVYTRVVSYMDWILNNTGLEMLRMFFVNLFKNIIVLLILKDLDTFAQHIINYREHFCYTPSGEIGACTSLKYCPEIVNLFTRVHPNMAKRYSMESQRVCGNQITPDQYPLVCCTIIVKSNNNEDLTVTTPTTTTTTATSTTSSTTTTTKKPKNDSSSRSIANETYTSCDTPDFQSGFCKPLENCPELFNKLRRNSEDEEFKKYLRLSHTLCGEEKTIVCCPEINIKNILNNRYNNASQRYNKLPSEEEGCGLVNLSTTKIVDGDDSEIGAWPWMALIGYDPWSVRPFRCGGTLVSAQHVITAAHCIRHDLSFVRLGEYDLTNETETEHMDVNVVKYSIHPQFGKNRRSDMAVLLLEKIVTFSDLIAPICMPTSSHLRSKSYVNTMPYVAGWGYTSQGGATSPILKQVQLPVLENEVCRRIYTTLMPHSSAQEYDESVICAGFVVGGKDTCKGDSGGPLMIPELYKGITRYYLIGVVSYGHGCGQAPGIYISTQYWMDWIIEQISTM
ncbi:serine protease filzig-like [Glossina fuscipes]|uniref:Acrosin n=1 Tax=Glossina fuscipes TaxID=7396 RepID=A0A8U0W8U0_9MUSC|nr:serine protease filzig-like [Glossina fuscipes]